LTFSTLVAGTKLDEVTHAVIAIDCTVLLPLLVFGGLLLWRRRPWGYVLGGFLLVKMATTGFTLAFTTALGAWWARGIDPFNAFLFVLSPSWRRDLWPCSFPTCAASEEGELSSPVTVLRQRDRGRIADEERIDQNHRHRKRSCKATK